MVSKRCLSLTFHAQVHILFKQLMVFETQKGMEVFIQRCRAENGGRLEKNVRCVSLDGAEGES